MTTLINEQGYSQGTPQQQSPKTDNRPAKYYLEWKPKRNVFTFWHKEESANKDKNLPYKVKILAYRYTLKGYDREHGVGVFSNEVKSSRDTFILKRHPNRKFGQTNAAAIAVIDDYGRSKNWLKDRGTRLYAVLYIVDEFGLTNALMLTGGAFKYIKAYREAKRPEFEGVNLQSIAEQSPYGRNYYPDFVPDANFNTPVDAKSEADRLEGLWQEYHAKTLRELDYHSNSNIPAQDRSVGVPPAVKESPTPTNPPTKPDNPF